MVRRGKRGAPHLLADGEGAVVGDRLAVEREEQNTADRRLHGTVELRGEERRCFQCVELAVVQDRRDDGYDDVGGARRGDEERAHGSWQEFSEGALSVDHTDGLSVAFADWRFNLRMSNTEPVIRLNVESKANPALMEEKLALLLSLVEA